MKKLGICPYCSNEGVDRDYSEHVEGVYDNAPYVVFNCSCESCNKNFSEYYSLDEVKEEDNDEERYHTTTISKPNKEILLKALNLLIDSEGDTKDYTELIKLLNNGVVTYN